MATPIYEFGQIPRLDPTAKPRGRARRVRDAGQAPTVGVIYNPRSHRNLGADFDCGLCPHVHIAQPRERGQLPLALTEFAERGIDLLVINGGDGTVRDVLTCGQAIFGDDWPAIAVLPKGKTNALTVDLGVPDDWSLQDAIDALDHGNRVYRRPMAVSAAEEPGKAPGISRVAGFILGAGAFTKATQAGQSAHKLGAFDSMVVAVTGLWALCNRCSPGAAIRGVRARGCGSALALRTPPWPIAATAIPKCASCCSPRRSNACPPGSSPSARSRAG